ncbi:hypothetical protein Asp14428_56650 [Actinoplanes sp. NBRC 14428]|uniref:Uncharacterized protein DUF3455 n=1 Tax=Pseudosporangium ferrugineum TaxID=439699 RepID=A0A2T0RDS8_9ACTN|nr:DUF3455 domain-containing protein [Pseudosporangium ferrugineum]PRY19260.1 uncharacterized protein DUF3455 [Pseudosporangium ferrugineum]BCJ54190.1 hypothetical protein Asp14428_56650 [Actinoplanes sp. NBRC 14428]
MRTLKRKAVIATAAAAVVAAIGGVTYQASAAEAPTGLQPPAGLKIIGSFVVGQGTQNYTCVGGKFADPSVPEANLFDGANRKIHHFGGPTWQSESDGSAVTAAKLNASPVPGAIPELLLEVKSHSGQGMLSTVTYIQRMNTFGGLPPATPCTDGEKASVPYNANYIFWGN